MPVLQLQFIFTFQRAITVIYNGHGLDVCVCMKREAFHAYKKSHLPKLKFDMGTLYLGGPTFPLHVASMPTPRKKNVASMPRVVASVSSWPMRPPHRLPRTSTRRSPFSGSPRHHARHQPYHGAEARGHADCASACAPLRRSSASSCGPRVPLR